jgi:hypothetical protein
VDELATTASVAGSAATGITPNIAPQSGQVSAAASAQHQRQE